MTASVWVVKSGREYYQFTGAGRVYYTKDIQKANRFMSEKSAEFVAKRLGGEVIGCREMGETLVEM